MRLAATLLGVAISGLSVSASAQSEEAVSYPLSKLVCATTTALEGSEFDVRSALIFNPVPFHITNGDRRLKFYRGLIAFEGGKSYQLAQPRITQSEMNDKDSRFGNLRQRQSDDDIPTAFTSDGVEYELQAITGFTVTERTGENTFTINQFDPITVILEAVTDSSTRETPVWTGQCTMSYIKDEA